MCKNKKNFYTKEYFTDLHKVISVGNDFSGLAHKSILVTGAAGLIGSAVADLLICLNELYHFNTDIYLAARSLNRLRERFGEWEKKSYIHFVHYEAGENIDFQIKGLDYIVHAAGNAHPEAFSREPVETMKANFIGLLKLLEYVGQNRVKRLVYISSSEIYGNRSKAKDSSFMENEYGYVDILNPRSCYPVSKRAGETLLVSFIKEYGIDGSIVRPGHIYGPTQTDKDSRAAAQFIRKAVAGENIVMKSEGGQKRSYCHCFDCASAILTVILRGKKGEAYNISNHFAIVTIREFAEMCAYITGVEIKSELPLKEERGSYNMMKNSALDSEKLEKIGWRGYYNLENGLRETIGIMNCRRGDSILSKKG